MPAVVAIFGIYQGLRLFSVPGYYLEILVSPFFFFLGVAGGAVLGIGMSLIALSRGETQAAKSLILLPVILGCLVMLAVLVWFFGLVFL